MIFYEFIFKSITRLASWNFTNVDGDLAPPGGHDVTLQPVSLLLSSMAVSSAAVDMSVFFCLPVLSIAFELSGKKFINLPFNLPRICHLSFDFQRV